MNVKEFENLINTYNDKFDGYSKLKELIANKSTIDFFGHTLEFVDQSSNVDLDDDWFGGNSTASFIVKLDNDLFEICCDASSWIDDGSLGEYNVYKVQPVEKTITVYERV